jgi:transcriptional regulator NrdR family protein
MVCIYCGSETKVTNSRERARNPSIWRRRTCIACVAQFTTNELPDYSAALIVENQANKHLQPFSRDKLFLSFYKSLGHRPDALLSATELTSTIIGRLLRPVSKTGSRKQAKDGVISVGIISKTSYEVLKRYDPLAATAYRAYHPIF